MSRVLGLDLGTKRIGVAVSDGLGLTAQPYGTVDRHGGRRDMDAIAQLLMKLEADRIVLGLPINLEGENGDAARRAQDFAEKLRTTLQVPVDLIDERFSTVEAEQVLLEANVSRARRKDVIDKLAATIILQRWLDAQKAAPAQTTTGPTP